MWTTLANWKLFLAGGLIACTLLLSVLLNRAWDEVAEKTAVIEQMRIEAEKYQTESEAKARRIGSDYSRMVEQIKSKDTALQAARARFGTCPPSGGVRFVRVPVESSDGEARVPEGTSEPSESERLAVSTAFVNACAADAAFVGAVQEWRVANDLPVQ